jgi:hypothetical protein
VRGFLLFLLAALAGAGVAGFFCVIGAEPGYIDDLSDWNGEPERWIVVGPSIAAATTSFGIGLAAAFSKSVRRRHLRRAFALILFAVASGMFLLGFAEAIRSSE